MNNKILSVVLVAGIAVTGFAGISSASETGLFKGNSEIREIKEKLESGLEITQAEQTLLDEAKQKKGLKHGGKRKGGGKLSDEEKAELETMSDEEKKAFFEAKKADMNAQKQAKSDMMAALIAGDTLSAEQETMRAELLTKLETRVSEGKETREGTAVIVKILAGDVLTADEQIILDEMQAQKAEREAQKALLEPIKAKLDAGETLTDDEQALLDAAKAERKENGKGKGKKGSKGKHNRDQK
jgi:hypothetical protein